MGDGAAPEEHGYRGAGRELRWLAVALIVHACLHVTYMAGWLPVAFPAAPGGGATTFGDVSVLLRTAQHAALLATLAAGAAFTLWVRRVVLNSRSMRGWNVPRSPWSGLWIVVPVANLWMPFVVADDLWAGTRSATHRRRDPRTDARRPKTAPLIKAWWATTIGGALWRCGGPLSFAWLSGRELLPVVLALPAALELVALYLQ